MGLLDFRAFGGPTYFADVIDPRIGRLLGFILELFGEPLVPYPAHVVSASRQAGSDYRACNLAFFEEGTMDEDLSRAWEVTRAFYFHINRAVKTGQRLPLSTVLDTMASVMYRVISL